MCACVFSEQDVNQDEVQSLLIGTPNLSRQTGLLRGRAAAGGGGYACLVSHYYDWHKCAEHILHAGTIFIDAEMNRRTIGQTAIIKSIDEWLLQWS